MSRRKQEKGKGQEDKRILRLERPYVFFKLLCGSCWACVEIRNMILRQNHEVGMKVESRESTQRQVDGPGAGKHAGQWSLMSNGLKAQRSCLQILCGFRS